MKVRIGLSFVLGVLFAIPSYFIFEYINQSHPFIMSFATGTLVFCYFMVYFILHKRYTDKKYKNAETEIGLTTDEKIIFRTNGNFNLCNKVKNCNIYFCQDKVVFLCLEKGNVTSETLPVASIRNISSDLVLRVLITTIDNRVYVITTADAKALSFVLSEEYDCFSK